MCQNNEISVNQSITITEGEKEDSKLLANNDPKKRNVNFSNLEVRYFSYELGDNPGGKLGGPPLTISWEHFHAAKIPIDSYEANCHNTRAVMPLHKSRRTKLLLRAGENLIDILDRINEVEEIKRQREESLITRTSSLEFTFTRTGEKVSQYFDKVRTMKRKLSQEKISVFNRNVALASTNDRPSNRYLMGKVQYPTLIRSKKA